MWLTNDQREFARNFLMFFLVASFYCGIGAVAGGICEYLYGPRHTGDRITVGLIWFVSIPAMLMDKGAVVVGKVLHKIMGDVEPLPPPVQRTVVAPYDAKVQFGPKIDPHYVPAEKEPQ